MNKNRKRRNRILFVLVLASIVAGILVNKLNRSNKAKWSHISQCYMDDFNKNGKQEMLINYRSKENSAAMKLVDVEAGETLWVSESKQLRFDRSKIIVFDDRFVLGYAFHDNNDSTRNKYKIGIEAFDGKTGNKIWDTPIQGSNDKSSITIFEYYNKLLTVESNSETKTRTVYTINPLNGKTEWNIEIPGNALTKPLQLNSCNLLFNDFYMYHLLNTETMQYSNLTATYEIESVLPWENNAFLFLINDSLLYKYDSTLQQLRINDAPLYYAWDNRRFEATYKNNLITINRSEIENSNYFFTITSNPLNRTEGRRTFKFEDNIKEIESKYYHHRKDFTPQYTAFHEISTQFVPLVVGAVDTGENIQKELIVFDLDSMEVAKKSQSLANLEITDIVYNNGFYALNLELKTEEELVYCIALLNGKTGELTKSLQFISDKNYIHPSWSDEYKMFSGNYIYGSDTECAWCLSYPELELTYASSSDLEIKDNTAQVEKRLNLK